MLKKLFLLTILVALLAACSSAPSTQMRYVFPIPPEQPRVEWLGTYASQDDFPKSGFQRFFEAIAGKPPLETFIGPFGIVADDEGRVFIVDLYAKNIRVYDMNNHTVKWFLKEPTLGRAYGLAIDARKQLYVADAEQRRVLVYTRDGHQVKTIGDDKELTNPVAVELDEARQRLYISDSDRRRVNAYSLDGKWLFAFGEQAGEGRLLKPQGVAVGPDGHLYVADAFDSNIKIYAADGGYLRKIGVRDNSMGGMDHPRDLAFDSEGHLWVADYRRTYFQIFDTAGQLLLAVGSAERSTHKMAFSSPTAIHITPTDEVYVSDVAYRRFSRWQYLSQKYLADHPLTQAELDLISAQTGNVKSVK